MSEAQAEVRRPGVSEVVRRQCVSQQVSKQPGKHSALGAEPTPCTCICTCICAPHMHMHAHAWQALGVELAGAPSVVEATVTVDASPPSPALSPTVDMLEDALSAEDDSKTTIIAVAVPLGVVSEGARE